MAKYESLLLGGKAMKPKRKVSQSTLDALAKGRATRAANLKKQKGGGNYTQDYVDESQINYAGSPLDVYYLGTPADAAEERAERGEVKGRGKGKKGKGVEEVLMKPARGGKMNKPTGASKRTESAKEFLKHQNFSGMDVPTKQQIKTGGKIKKGTSKAGKKKIQIEDIEGGAAAKVDIPEAIRVLAVLAGKFGLKLVK